MGVHLWIRAETRTTEQRTPLVPSDCRALLAGGVRITVEESPQRVFSVDDYVAAGCDVAPTGSWVTAPDDAYILGIKELPETPADLRHTHIFFAHAFKGQRGARAVLARFQRGGGGLLDIEYLTLANHRLVAFGRWAGYVGAALGVLALRDRLSTPLLPTTRPHLDALLGDDPSPLTAVVIGARGRSGGGALEALEVAGARITAWDSHHTRHLDRPTLLAHDLLVNCVVWRGEKVPVWVGNDDLAKPRTLTMVADVTCDVTSPANLVPVNTAVTTWSDPVRRVSSPEQTPLDVIAIDNLPSLLPREASVSFSAELSALLTRPGELAARQGPWASAREAYLKAVR